MLKSSARTSPLQIKIIVMIVSIFLIGYNIFRPLSSCNAAPLWETPYVQTNYSSALTNTTTEGPKKEKEDDKKCCECSASGKFVPEEEATDKLSFEDYIGNTVYIKYDSGEKREKRSIFYIGTTKNVWKRSIPQTNKSLLISTNQLLNLTTKIDSNTSRNYTKPTPIKLFNATTKDTKVTINGLSHFTRYSIEVQACNPLVVNASCSTPAITSVWTMKKGRYLKSFLLI